jgi:sterol O-acyltransferase
MQSPASDWLNVNNFLGQYDYVALALYIVYLLAFLVLPVRSLLHHSLPPASSVVITCEQIRLLMKTHAFVRENIPKVFQNSHKNGN